MAGNEIGIESIQDLMKYETSMITQRRNEVLESPSDAEKSQIEYLLNGINSAREEIKNREEWIWARDSMLRWESVLRSKYGTCVGHDLPKLPKASECPKK